MFKFNASNAAYTISLYCLLVLLFSNTTLLAQNSMVGDGFGGRSWYKPTNYSVGSYSAFTVCDRNSSNQLLGWGANGFGELGVDNTSIFSSTMPLEVPNMTDVKYYTTGYCMAAIKQDNTGWVWGNGFGYTPTQVISDVKFVDASMEHITFVKNDGTVWSIGSNAGGNFGDGTSISNYLTPVQMIGITNATRVACSDGKTYILLADGSVKVSGTSYGPLYSFYLPLGVQDPNLFATNIPLEIINLQNIVDIKSTTIGMMALMDNGDVYLIGSPNESSMNFYAIVTKLDEFSNIVAISGMCDGFEFLLIDENKNCYSTRSGNLIVAVSVIDILVGEIFSYVVKEDGRLWARGSGDIWLGQNSNTYPNYSIIDINLVPELCPTAINQVFNTSCNSFEVYMAEGTAPYQYNIGFGNQSSPIFSNLNFGTYTITVTDATGQVTTLQTTLQPVTASFDTSNLDPIMGVGEYIVTSTSIGASSYSWYVCETLYSGGDSLWLYPYLPGDCCIKLIASNYACKDSVEYCFYVPYQDTVIQTSCSSFEVLMTQGWPIYQYSIGNGFQSSNVFTNVETGNYTIEVTDEWGGAFQIPYSLTGIDASFASSTSEDTLLLGSNLQFSINPVVGNSYQWYACDSLISTNSSVNFNFLEQGTCCIKLVVSNQFCTDSSEVCYTILDNEAFQLPCQSFEVKMNFGTPPYQYNIGNGNQSSPIFQNLELGNYTITVTDATGAVYTINTSIVDDDTKVVASFEPSEAQDVGQGSTVPFQNNSLNANTFSWFTCDTLFSTNENIAFTFLTNGVCCIKLLASNQWCIDSSEVCFDVKELQSISFPNIFTPNQDGDNDLFHLSPFKIEKYHAIILNRWGNVMGEIDQDHASWDGMTDGKEASDGVYFYTVDYLLYGEEKKYHGFVHLVR